MRPIPIPLRSNPGDFNPNSEAIVFNAFAQFDGPEAKVASRLKACAGLKRFGGDANSPCRGMFYTDDDDVIYSANGFGLYKTAEDGTLTKLATIPGENPVYFARNDAEPALTMLVAETLVYEIKEGAATYKNYDFTPLGVTFAAARFLFWDNQKVYYSDVNSSTVNGLSFFEAEGDPDGITKVHGVGNTVYVFGEKTVEIWQVTTDADAPFARVSGADIRFGSESPHSIKDYNDGVLVVDNNNTVKIIAGFSSVTISTNEITRLIAGETDKSKIVATVYTQDQNRFVALHGTNWTREYNATTQAWHKRHTLHQEDWDSQHSAQAWGKIIFGSKSLGLFSELDADLYTENGSEMIVGFITPNTHAFPQGISFSEINIDVETGETDLSREPKLMFDYTDDGKTWSMERQLSLGNLGDYVRRVRITGLGQTSQRGRAYRVRISDPVAKSILAINTEASPVRL